MRRRNLSTQMKNYITYITQLANSKSNVEFLNSDEEHALAVLVQIIKSAQSTLRIFAGALCSTVPSNPEYISALSDFIEKGGKLVITLNAFSPEDATNSNLFKRLAYYIELGKDIHIYRTNAHPYLVSDPFKNEIHFTIGDDCSYRVETDIVKKTAKCNFNNPEAAANLIEFFDKIIANNDHSSEITEVVKNLFVD